MKGVFSQVEHCFIELAQPVYDVQRRIGRILLHSPAGIEITQIAVPVRSDHVAEGVRVVVHLQGQYEAQGVV